MREMFHGDKRITENDVEANAVATDIRNKYLEDLTVNNPEVKDFFERIVDTKMITDLVIEEYVKIGLSPEDIRDVPFFLYEPEKLEAVTGQRSRAAYNMLSDVILISRPLVEKVMLACEKDSPSLETFNLRMLVGPMLHERVHSISGTIVYIGSHEILDTTGFHIGLPEANDNAPDSRFKKIDEALTELWSKQLLIRYLQHSGYSKESIAVQNEMEIVCHTGERPNPNWSYTMEIGFLFRFVERVAEVFDLSTEVVLNALKRAKVLNKSYDFEIFLSQLSADPQLSGRFGPNLFNLVEASRLTAAWEELKLAQ